MVSELIRPSIVKKLGNIPTLVNVIRQLHITSLSIFAALTVSEELRIHDKQTVSQPHFSFSVCHVIVIREVDSVSLVLNDEMLAYCEIITVTVNEMFDPQWISSLLSKVLVRFCSSLFESGNTSFWKRCESATEKIQSRLVPVGFGIFKEMSVSTFWLCPLWTISTQLPDYSDLIACIPRLFDAILSLKVIQILIEFVGLIYSVNLSCAH
jgi:hypothetical protein